MYMKIIYFLHQLVLRYHFPSSPNTTSAMELDTTTTPMETTRATPGISEKGILQLIGCLPHLQACSAIIVRNMISLILDIW